MIEQRNVHRVRTLKTGKIVFNGRFSVMDCVVRNLSQGGACIEVASTLGIPDAFDLSIQPDGTTYTCIVAWKSADRIGVSFADGQ